MPEDIEYDLWLLKKAVQELEFWWPSLINKHKDEIKKRIKELEDLIDV